MYVSTYTTLQASIFNCLYVKQFFNKRGTHGNTVSNSVFMQRFAGD